jgi:hypothetical protein
MPACGEVGRITEDAVGTPCHEVRNTGSDLESATRAQVCLDRLGVGDGLHVPFAAGANLGTTPAGREPIDIEVGMRLTCTSGPTPGSVRARHVTSLRRDRRAIRQYQPTA